MSGLASLDALEKINDGRIVEPLIAALDDNEPVFLKKAIIVLGNLADSRAVQLLIETLKDKNDDIRLTAVTALVKIGDPAVEPMILALGNGTSEARRGVADALGQLKTDRAVVPLVAALKR